jgi:hypothetical protein
MSEAADKATIRAVVKFLRWRCQRCGQELIPTLYGINELCDSCRWEPDGFTTAIRVKIDLTCGAHERILVHE